MRNFFLNQSGGNLEILDQGREQAFCCPFLWCVQQKKPALCPPVRTDSIEHLSAITDRKNPAQLYELPPVITVLNHPVHNIVRVPGSRASDHCRAVPFSTRLHAA
jgi:hypothetical protein